MRHHKGSFFFFGENFVSNADLVVISSVCEHITFIQCRHLQNHIFLFMFSRYQPQVFLSIHLKSMKYSISHFKGRKYF